MNKNTEKSLSYEELEKIIEEQRPQIEERLKYDQSEFLIRLEKEYNLKEITQKIKYLMITYEIKDSIDKPKYLRNLTREEYRRWEKVFKNEAHREDCDVDFIEFPDAERCPHFNHRKYIYRSNYCRFMGTVQDTDTLPSKEFIEKETLPK